MTSVARFIAVVVGVAGLVVGTAAVLRAALLAAEPGIAWSRPAWWTSVTSGASLATGIAAGVTAVVAVILLVLAVRQLRTGSSRRPLIEFDGADGQARLDVHALEKALERSVRERVDGVRACRVTLGKEPGGWFARVEAVLPARDLSGVQERITRLLAGDLDRLGGVRLEGVDLVVAAVTGIAAQPAAAPADQAAGAAGRA